MVVAILPGEMQVNETLRDEVVLKQSPPLKKEFWTNDQPNTFMANKLKNTQIPYINLYETFLKESKSRPLYKPKDSHWNIAGNNIAAITILNSLNK